jgi:hypothetical protein
MANPRKIIIVLIALLVGLLHFIIGPDYQGPFKDFVSGYLIDILLPFSLYLLMGLFKNSIFQHLILRGVVIFLIGLSVEILQLKGIKLFGNTADINDLLAYAFGILSAMLFDRFALRKV